MKALKVNKKTTLVLIIFSVFISLIIVEVLLQLIGFKPWKYEKSESGNQEIFKKDNELGWVAKKGIYELNINSNVKSKIKFTIEDGGNRQTSIDNLKKNNIFFIGGSFTQGWGVNDDNTFAHLIQNKFNNYKVYNFAQSGYGGVQSLLLLKRKLKNYKSTKLIVYGFIEHHEQRNVARKNWLETLLRYSKRGYDQIPKVPYASINKKGKLIYHKPVGYIMLPLREKFASIVLIEKFYMKQTTKYRKKNQKAITKKIFIELNNVAKKNNTNFLIVNLSSSNKNYENEYKNFLSENKIDYVNCNFFLSKDLLVKNDFHPNEKAHSLYSKCISSYISKNNLLF
jgi:hypothetical protein